MNQSTSWREEWESPQAPRAVKMPLQDILIGDLLGTIDEHNVAPLMHSPAGQRVAYFNSVETVAQRMDRLLTEAREALF